MQCVQAIAILVMVVVSAARAVATTDTVTGQVIDLACYMLDKGNTGNTHRARGYTCAHACAIEGFQVGLLTASGKVYHITGGLAANKNARLAPHMGHSVSITGDVTEKDGTTLISSGDLTMIKP